MHIRRQKVSWEPLKRESLSRVVRKKVVLIDPFISLIEGRHAPSPGFQQRVPYHHPRLVKPMTMLLKSNMILSPFRVKKIR
ncbi:hypothetical protein TorRG33x02_315860 [Trema orientale]|uniref:Uncharacterized protein n=1 Tax=Trema orientale TaxID=63057 RepID=A0A2P5BM91_TREOI|nr:hypothetical protein TorRG33x02_315860 [Trema orientale]